jgi:hypothetical protein
VEPVLSFSPHPDTGPLQPVPRNLRNLPVEVLNRQDIFRTEDVIVIDIAVPGGLSASVPVLFFVGLAGEASPRIQARS